MAKITPTLAVREALYAWGDDRRFLLCMADAWSLATGKKHENTRRAMAFAIQEYVLLERKEVLAAHFKKFGGHSKVSREEVDRLNPPEDIMRKLNMVVGFHGIDRVFIHLYVHAYLMKALDFEDTPIEQLDALLESLA
jgi:hypothetical protein